MDNIFGWCGYVFDNETSYYLARNRHYFPARGRWLQRDPAGYMDSSNLYAYGTGNPIDYTDPFGLQSNQTQAYPFYETDPVMYGSGGLTPLLFGAQSFDDNSMSLVGGIGHLMAVPTSIPDSGVQVVVGGGAHMSIMQAPEYGEAHLGHWDYQPPSFMSFLHSVLDVAGCVPGIGDFADAINAGLYLVEGDFGNAAISFVAVVPVLGDMAKAGRVVKNAEHVIEAGGTALKEARRLGKEGERLGGIIKHNTEHIPSITGAAYRVPDVLDHEAKVLMEVKNTRELSLTGQIEDFIHYAQTKDYTFILRVREGTELSGPPKKAIAEGKIRLELY